MEPLSLTPEDASKRVQGADKIKLPASEYPPVLPNCSRLEPVFQDTSESGDGPTTNLWVVRAVFPMIPYMMALPVTMTVYRDETGCITLFNSIRVPTDVEDAILALGPVTNVVKLGQFHGVSDAYYVTNPKFGTPKLWVLPGGSVADGLPIEKTKELSCTNVPVPGSQLYVLGGLVYHEAALIVPDARHGKTIIVTDSLMNVTDSVGLPLFGRFITYLFFMSTDAVPRPAPLWLKHAVTLCGKDKVQGWFDDILGLDFRHLVSSHGVPALDLSKDAVAAVVKSKLATY